MEQTKTKKKSKSLIVMLVAILLCIAVVLGMGGFTYAKYVSSKSVETKTANVAKWGWQISADATNMFSTKYDATTGAAIDTSSSSSSTVGVKASSTTVAPNTNGSMTFSITGSAEVRSKITVTASGTAVTLYGGTVAQDSPYEPIVWTLKKDSTVVKSTDEKELSSVSLSDITTYLNGMSAIVEAGDTTCSYVGSYELSWEWAFENSTNTDTYNLYDTILGACANYTAAATVYGPKEEEISVTGLTSATIGETTYTVNTALSFDFSITVEQIQGETA